MNKRVLAAVAIVFIGIVVYFIQTKKYSSPTETAAPKNTASVSQNYSSPAANNIPLAPTAASNASSASGFMPPLPDAKTRVTKKPFGIYITPATSPVQPERFAGYHTGADFEIFPSELNATVPVDAVCSGKLALKEYASGYGGVAVESCTLASQSITVIYGHLNLASVKPNIGDVMPAGQPFADLGANKSVETNGERKHLHLGFHKGTAINILGYVQNKSQLNNWINPCLYVCK
ncbi:MAG: peptidoglycan DD-metalloendopeptidase family protein [Candidatus Pacebacteria bacterium]|nr:peptidoglycan DD-metalloendopeptidase family protein [Candidatus Paceibacterota bacterium]MDR3583204.1 peptidoglycan DD-metalloendopeptidase family protein [Candidatus Paceibacterota bacterium]